MSYILDALRRADAERERGQVPGLHSQVSPRSAVPPTMARNRRGRRNRRTGVALALGGTVLAIALAWWIGRASTDTPPDTPPDASPAASAGSPAVASGPVSAAPTVVAPPAAAAPAPTSTPTPPRAQPWQADARVPPARYDSPLSRYQAQRDIDVGSWREANDLTARIGGWRAYAREAHAPDTPASTPAAQSHKHPHTHGGQP